MHALTTIKRSELYQLVWQEPMVRLAKTYGLSDVGLAKICRKHNIPRPPRGFWARKRHGQNPRQIPLPKLDEDVEIELRDPDGVPNSAADAGDELATTVAAEESRAPIVVADSLRGGTELVSRANGELKTARTDESGLIDCPKASPLDVCVSKGSLRRA